MSRDEREEMQLRVWVRLDEVKNLVSVCEKGYDAEIPVSNEEMRSICGLQQPEKYSSA